MLIKHFNTIILLYIRIFVLNYKLNTHHPTVYTDLLFNFGVINFIFNIHLFYPPTTHISYYHPINYITTLYKTYGCIYA